MKARAALLPGAILGALLCAACGDAGSSAEITDRRVATRAYRNVEPGAGSMARFETPGKPDDHLGSDDLAELIDYDLPAGWKELPPTRDRLVHLQPAGNPAASCYLSFLGGSAGGLESNVNRWRTQFGAAPLRGEEISALPTHEIFGREGTLIEVSGTFVGMGDGVPQPGFRLLGLAVCEPAGSLFLKLIGPTALVEAERESFLALASSLRIAEDHHEHDAGGAAPDAGATVGGSLRWTAPAGWTQAPPRAMREVTFLVGAAECYVTRLTPDAADLRANLDRWRNQFSLPAMTDAELAALQQITLLGMRTPLLEISGSYSGMSGTPVAGQALLGAAVYRPQDSLFVKFVGPAEVVRAERGNFLAFLASLGEDS